MNIPTIICVDDEHNVLLTLRNQLQRQFPNYMIEIAESGEETLELVEQLWSTGVEVPLVITDQIMPAMKGDELLIELHARHPEILTVLLTGQARAEEVGNAVNRANLYRFISKPWDELDLNLTVTEALRRYRQEQQITQQQAELAQANQELATLNAALEQQVQKRTQQLLCNEQQLRLFVEHTPAAVAMFDCDMHYLLVSRRWSDDYQLGNQNLIGRSHYEVFPDLPERWKSIHQRCLAGATEITKEDSFQRSDGSVVWIQWEVHPWYSEANQIGGIILFTEVISDRKQAELALLQAIDALQASELKLRQITDAIPGAVYQYQLFPSGDQQFLFMSAGLFDLYGITAEAVCANSQVMWDTLSPEQLDDFVLSIQRSATTLAPWNHEYSIEIEGQRRWICGQAIPVPQADGSILWNGILTDISDRKRAEQALAAIEHQQRSILENIPSFITKVDREGRMLFLNRLAPGFSADDVLGQTLETFTNPESRATQRAALTEAFSTGQTLTIETQGIGANGTPTLYEVRIVPLPAEAGAMDTAIVVATDITDRKQAEIALQESEARRRLALDLTNTSSWEFDVATGEAIWSDNHYRLMGLNPGELASNYQTWRELVYPEDLEQTEQAFSQALATRLPLEVEYRVVYPNGTIRWILTKGQGIYNEQGTAVRMVGVMLDISDRKQTEITLQESQEFIRRIAESSPNVIYIYDLVEQRNVYVNREVYGSLGYQVDEIRSCLGQGIAALAHPEDLGRMYTYFGNFNNLADGTICELEYRMRHKNGEWRWFTSRDTVFKRDAEGRVVQIVGSSLDISDRKRSEIALRTLVQGTASTIDEEFFSNLVQHLVEALDVAHAIMTKFCDGQFHTLAFWSNGNFVPNITYLPQEATACARVIEQGEYYCEQAVRQEHPGNRYLDELRAESYFGIALQNNAGQTIGHLCVIDNKPITNAEWFHSILRIFAVRAAAELERTQAKIVLQQLNAELEQRVQQRTRELARSEQDLRTIFNNVYDAIFIHDMDGTILDVNDRATDMFGTSRVHLLTCSVADLGPPGMPTEQLPLVFQQAQTEGAVVTEWRGKRFDDGTVFDTEVTLRLTQLGNAPVYIVCVRDISDRKQSEAQLQQQEFLLRTMYEGVEHSICLVDVLMQEGSNQGEFRYVGWNRATEEKSGISSAEIAGKTPIELLGEHQGSLVQQHYQDCLEARVSITYEEYLSFQNQDIWWLTTLNPLKDEADNIYRIVITTFEISDRKQAEQALLEAQQFAQSIADKTPAALYIYDLVNQCNHYSNRSILEVLGYTADQIQAMGSQLMPTLLHPHDRDRLAHHHQAIATATDDEDLELEYQMRHANGEWRWFYSRDSVFKRDQAGQVTQYIGAAQDITDRKHAELALRDSEERFRATFEQAAVGIIQANIAGELIRVNQKFCTIVGYSEAELYLKHFSEITHPDDLANDQINIDRLLAGAASFFTIEKRYIHANGAIVWTNLSVSLVHDTFGEPQYFIAAIQDISEAKRIEVDRQRLAQELRQINLELEQRVTKRTLELQQAMKLAETANHAKSTFLATMSHELRTPLNAILGFAQLMSRDLSWESEKRQQLGIINRSGEHLLTLINDILEISKIEAGHTIFEPNEFDLYNLLNLLEEMFQIPTRNRGLQLIFDLDFNLPQYIKTDENKLRQVLINLLGNAIKFTDSGSVTLQIRNQELEEADSLIAGSNSVISGLAFEVQDTGIGIEPAELESLFQPFIQAKNRTQAQEGTGLGLPISSRFVQLMGGRFTVQSIPGNGSTFVFAIPIKLADFASLPTSAPARTVLHLAPNQPQYRILVVEDNAMNRSLLVQLLQSVGFEVQIATQGEEAIALWETWQPDLIWMDMRMPVMDGYDATQRIRALESQRSLLESRRPTVIIALSASAFEEERNKILMAGCNDSIRKPFKESYLLEKIAEHLGVQYLYLEAEQSATQPPAPPLDSIAALRSLPPALLSQFHQATIQLDSQQLAELIEQVTPLQPAIATFLTDKLNDFDLETILQLLNAAMQINE